MNGKKLKVLIVDDEPLARNYIRKLLSDEPEIEIAGEFGNGRDAAKFISTQKLDLVFLDVQMPEMDGFRMLQSLEMENPPLIIFTTAYEEYAIRAFELHALDYLLKPFDQARFKQSLTHAKQRLASLTDRKMEAEQITELLRHNDTKPQYLERLLIKQDGRIVFLKSKNIDWIKAEDKYINIYFGKSGHLVRQTLSAIKSQLDPQIFVQIHRSIIVNVERITELQPMFNNEYAVILENGLELSLSRNYKNQLFEIIGKPL